MDDQEFWSRVYLAVIAREQARPEDAKLAADVALNLRRAKFLESELKQ